MLLMTAASLCADGTPRAEVHAVRTTQAMTIDGALSEPVWDQAPPVVTFTQHDPADGKPATQPTRVRILYDGDAIYVGAEITDAGPVDLRLVRRDADTNTDWFGFLISPYHDGKSGNGFWVTASGVQADEVLYNDTYEDFDWDGVWSSATKLTPTGWNVEMRIPLSQLHFNGSEVQVWGINVIRQTRHNKEDDRLANTPKTQTGFVSRFADLTGIESIHPKRSIELQPYLVGRSNLRNTISRSDPFTSRNETLADGGLDAKIGVTPNLTFTGTVNPDFGQVEVDPEVVNLSAFELFFPEKRPFFVEGSNLFAFGNGSSNNNFNFNFFAPIFFYSRRIGREPQGLSRLSYDYLGAPSETTILGAGKLTGRSASGWSIGFLDALTSSEKAHFELNDQRFSQTVEPRTNYLVSRLAKDLGTRGRLGFMFSSVDRSLTDSVDFLRRDSRFAGLDAYWFFGKNKDVVLQGLLAGTRVEGSTQSIDLTQRSSAHYYQRPDAHHVTYDPSRSSLSGFGGRITLAKQTGLWKYNVQAQSYSPGFEINDIGFLQRADVTSSHAVLEYDNPAVTKLVRSRGFWLAKFQKWNWDGDLISNGVGLDLHTRLANYDLARLQIFKGYEHPNDRDTRGGPLTSEPRDLSVGAYYTTDPSRILSFDMNASHYYNARGTHDFSSGIGVTYQPSSSVKVSVTPTYDRFHGFHQYVRTVVDPTATSTFGSRYVFGELDQRTFDLGTRLDWTFSPHLSLQLYIQPFVSAGQYGRFKELRRPRTLDFQRYGLDGGDITFDPSADQYTVDPDSGGAAQAFSFRNPDFNVRSVRGNAVLRWEFHPGSTLFLVWNENRAAVQEFGDFSLRRDLSAIGNVKSDDVFLVKVRYYLPL